MLKSKLHKYAQTHRHPVTTLDSTNAVQNLSNSVIVRLEARSRPVGDLDLLEVHSRSRDNGVVVGVKVERGDISTVQTISKTIETINDLGDSVVKTGQGAVGESRKEAIGTIVKLEEGISVELITNGAATEKGAIIQGIHLFGSHIQFETVLAGQDSKTAFIPGATPGVDPIHEPRGHGGGTQDDNQSEEKSLHLSFAREEIEGGEERERRER